MKQLLHIAFFLNLFLGCDSESANLQYTKKKFAGYEKANKGQNIKQILPVSNTLATIRVGSGDIQKFLDVEEMIQDISYLKLETRREALIGYIDNIYFVDDKIIIVDKESAQSVFIFNNKGKFLNKIHNIGKGPGEFVVIWDVAIDYTNKLIAIYDMRSQRINFFSLDGKFQGYKKTFFFFRSLKILDPTTYVMDCYTLNLHLSSGKNSFLLYSSPEGKVRHHALPYPLEQHNFNQWEMFKLEESDKIVYYSPRFSDTIHQIKKDAIVAKYFFDFGTEAIDKIHYSRVEDQTDFDKIMKDNPLYFSGKFADTDNVLYFNFKKGESRYFDAFYSKKSRRILSSEVTKTKQKFPTFDYPVTSHNNRFVSWMPASIIKQKTKYMNEHFPYYEVIKTFKADDNPVLMFYKIKDF